MGLKTHCSGDLGQVQNPAVRAICSREKQYKNSTPPPTQGAERGQRVGVVNCPRRSGGKVLPLRRDGRGNGWRHRFPLGAPPPKTRPFPREKTSRRCSAV